MVQVRQTAVIFTGTTEEAELLLQSSDACTKMSEVIINGSTFKVRVSSQAAQTGYSTVIRDIFHDLEEIVEAHTTFSAQSTAGQSLTLIAEALTGRDVRPELILHRQRMQAIAAAIRLTSNVLYKKGNCTTEAVECGEQMMKLLLPRALLSNTASDMTKSIQSCLTTTNSLTACPHQWLQWLYVSPHLQLAQVKQDLSESPGDRELLQKICLGTELDHCGLLWRWKNMAGVCEHVLTQVLESFTLLQRSGEGWSELEDILSQITLAGCTQALAIWLAVSNPRKSLTIWLLQSELCTKSEKQLNGLSNEEFKREAWRCYSKSSSETVDFPPEAASEQHLAALPECSPRLSQEAKLQLQAMAHELKSALCAVHAFVVWLHPSACSRLTHAAALFTKAADLIGPTGLHREYSTTVPLARYCDRWLRHNAFVTLMADQQMAINKNTENAIQKHDAKLNELENAISSGQAATAVYHALLKMHPVQAEERLLTSFLDTVELSVPDKLVQAVSIRTLLEWKQRRHIHFVGFSCGSLDARLSFFLVESSLMPCELGCVHFVRQRLRSAEQDLMHAWLSHMELAAHYDLLQGHSLFLCVSELSSLVSCLNPLAFRSTSLTRSVRCCVKVLRLAWACPDIPMFGRRSYDSSKSSSVGLEYQA